MSEGSHLLETTLDPAVFNHSLFTSLLQFWLPSYPTPLSDFSHSDILRWFAANAEVNEQCRLIAGPALSILGPSAIVLPEFESLEMDHEKYDTLSVLFDPFLDAQNTDKRLSPLPPAHVALALIILLDQMPRNIFRSDEQAVVYTHYDRLARALAMRISMAGLDQEQTLVSVPLWRIWFYLPLEHCESLEDHRQFHNVLGEMIEQARNRLDKPGEKFLRQAMTFGERHYTPLKTFGRFPWRNRWVGRENTESEEKWLHEGGDTFGTV